MKKSTPKSTGKPCEQCPWRIANHGRRHPGGFYRKDNLRRLWNQIRKGGRLQSCHPTDPGHADHRTYAGAKPGAKPLECIGSVILILREMRYADTLDGDTTAGELSPPTSTATWRRRDSGKASHARACCTRASAAPCRDPSATARPSPGCRKNCSTPPPTDGPTSRPADGGNRQARSGLDGSQELTTHRRPRTNTPYASTSPQRLDLGRLVKMRPNLAFELAKSFARRFKLLRPARRRKTTDTKRSERQKRLVSTAGTSGSIAWYERRPNRCADCGQFVETFPARSVRGGAALPVCRKHATAEELRQHEEECRRYDRLLGSEPTAERD